MSSTWNLIERPVTASPNRLYNPQFAIVQRGKTFTSSTTPANNDDTYLLDRWLLLSDGNDIVDVSRETTVTPNCAYSCCLLDTETANKKFGLLQILEARDAAAVIGGVASLSFKARKGASNATLGTLRAAILSWDGAADSVTSDVVSAWNGKGVDPTLVSNWSYESTPVDLDLTTEFQTFFVDYVDVDTTGATNVAVFIWIDDDDATVGDTVYLGDVKLEAGLNATCFQGRSYGDDLAMCQRYFFKTYNAESDPGTIGNVGFSYFYVGGLSNAAHIVQTFNRFPVTMRTTPTVTSYSPATGTPGKMRDYTVGGDITANVQFAGENGVIIYGTSSVATNVDASCQYTADAEL